MGAHSVERMDYRPMRVGRCEVGVRRCLSRSGTRSSAPQEMGRPLDDGARIQNGKEKKEKKASTNTGPARVGLCATANRKKRRCLRDGTPVWWSRGFTFFL